jgi:anthranilate phosphoribosyltransferase
MTNHALIKATSLLKELISGNSISREDSGWLVQSLLSNQFGEKNGTTLGAVLALLHRNGISDDELLGISDGIASLGDPPIVSVANEFVVAIVGSGKDDFKTFNVSTAAALVAASTGAYVAKIGSRAETSCAGTTDVLEYLGVNINLNVNDGKECLSQHRFAFFNPESRLSGLFSQYIGKVLFFNPLEYVLALFLGIDVQRVVFGLAAPDIELSAKLLKQKGKSGSIVVCGTTNDGGYIDEFSVMGPSRYCKVGAADFCAETFIPQDFGIRVYKDENVAQGGTVEENAHILETVLAGRGNEAQTDIVALNAGAILWCVDKVSSLREGYMLARQSIQDGAPHSLLEKVKHFRPNQGV